MRTVGSVQAPKFRENDAKAGGKRQRDRLCGAKLQCCGACISRAEVSWAS